MLSSGVINANTGGVWSEPLPTASSGVYYCTADDVGRMLGVGRGYWTATSTPLTLDDVNMIINMYEDDIDRETQWSWRTKISNQGRYEYHSLGRVGLRGSWFVWLGYPVSLKYRAIRQFDKSQGDVIEVYNGNQWEDWLTMKVEGQGQDFWVDYSMGTIYFRGLWVYLGLKEYVCRVVYRYGDTQVPRDITTACSLLVAAHLVETNDRLMLLPDGGTQVVTASQKSADWRKRAYDILEQYREFAVVGG
jgi:hypothetical protein